MLKCRWEGNEHVNVNANELGEGGGLNRKTGNGTIPAKLGRKVEGLPGLSKVYIEYSAWGMRGVDVCRDIGTK